MSIQGARSSTDARATDILATANALHTQAFLPVLLAGELQTVNRMAGGAIGSYATVVNTTATTVSRTGACVFYGLVVISSGALTPTVSVWDGITTGGTTFISSAAIGVANTFIPAAGVNGLGVVFATGLTIQLSTASAVYPILAF